MTLKRLLGFADPCGIPNAAGWYLRDFLFLIQYNWNPERVNVLCLRGQIMKGDFNSCRVMAIELGKNFVKPGEIIILSFSDIALFILILFSFIFFLVFDFKFINYFSIEQCPTAIGWEKNSENKLGPRLADLAPLMDPKR